MSASPHLVSINCLHDRGDDLFSCVLGARRGSGRVDEDVALDPLPYRTVLHRSREYRYDPADLLVTGCERCGSTGGFLARDWEDERIPAMCMDCHSELNTEAERAGRCCEDWCEAADLDHDGLCHP